MAASLCIILLGLWWTVGCLSTEPLKLSTPPMSAITVPGAIPYQICKTGPQKHDELSPGIRNAFEDISAKNPSILIRYFDDQACEDYIEKNFDDRTLDAYRNIRAGAYRADLFRYCFLFVDGGVYGDLTQTYHHPLSRFIDFDNDDLVLVRDRSSFSFPPELWPDASSGPHPPPVQVSFMAARPRHPIFKHAIDQICHNVKTRSYGASPLYPTGPCLFGSILRDHGFPYRCELEESGGSLKFIQTGEVAITTKSHDHKDQLLKRPSYTKLWLLRKAFA